MPDTPKTPRPSAAQKRTEERAERHEAWKGAQALLSRGDWYEGVTPEDVLSLAQWLTAGE